jgi:hypothetical protein
MKRKIIFFIFFVVLFFTACDGELHYTQAYELAECAESIEQTAKIAVITSDYFMRYNLHNDWMTEVAQKHGEENIIIYTWSYGNNFTESMTAIINEIAENSEICVLIINPAEYENLDDFTEILRKQRDDIFVVYLDSWWDTDTSGADLFLEVDSYEMAKVFPEKALKLGAKTLVYFFDSLSWDEDGNEYSREETAEHISMREKCAELGLLFVEIDIYGAIQCGSSYAWFMSETMPPLIEEHGNDIVFFGLNNERLFWSWSGKFIYLPMYCKWFEPCPIVITWGIHMKSPENYDLPFLVEEIKNHFDEENHRGRFASFPISMQFLFPLAAAEYGLLWANGDVPKEGICTVTLEKIMTDIIAEYTGLEHNITLFTHENKNHISVLPDWFVY